MNLQQQISYQDSQLYSKIHTWQNLTLAQSNHLSVPSLNQMLPCIAKESHQLLGQHFILSQALSTAKNSSYSQSAPFLFLDNSYFKTLLLSFNLQLLKDDLATSSKRKLRPCPLALASHLTCISLHSQWKGGSSLCPEHCTFCFCSVSYPILPSSYSATYTLVIWYLHQLSFSYCLFTLNQ